MIFSAGRYRLPSHWTLLPAKAMVLYGLDAHSIKEIEKGYVDVENMWNEVDESPWNLIELTIAV